MHSRSDTLFVDPLHRTDAEKFVDDLIRFDNRERYIEQSANSIHGKPAQLSSRTCLQVLSPSPVCGQVPGSNYENENE